MGWGFDDDQLLVPKSITSPSQLAGKSVGVLVGSSEDYELLGYLALEHLTGKVKVVSFAERDRPRAPPPCPARSTPPTCTARPATDLIAKGDHSLVNAEQIAKLGIPGLDVIAVATSVIKSDPTLVQDYVCAELQGSRDMTGPDAAKYLTASAKVQGITGNPQPDRDGDRGLSVHPAQPAAVLARFHPARPDQPHRQGVPADRHVPGLAGKAHVRSARRRRSRSTSTSPSSRRHCPVAARVDARGRRRPAAGHGRPASRRGRRRHGATW